MKNMRLHLHLFAMKKVNYSLPHLYSGLFLLCFTLCFLLCNKLNAQIFTPGLSFYAEAYAGFDINQPISQNKASFIYNHHRLNEATLNLVQTEFGHLSTNGLNRFKLGLQAGTYVERNLLGEPPALRHISEAYVGFRLSKTHQIWADMGIFNSHIGMESVKGIENDMLTRTLMADNSPYYESGLRIMYKTPKLDIGIFALNGWQNMRRFSLPRTGPSLGTQIQWRKGQFTLNSSSFFGILIPKPIKMIRAYHNLWISYASPSQTHKFSLTVDAGFQSYRSSLVISSSYWYAGALIYRGTINQHWAVTARAEAYLDPDGMFVSQGGNGTLGGNITGGAAGAEYRFNDDFCIRAEARFYQADGDLFETSSKPTANIYPTIGYFDQNLSGVLAVCYRIPPIAVIKEPRVVQQ
jgi:hypothetical protein